MQLLQRGSFRNNCDVFMNLLLSNFFGTVCFKRMGRLSLFLYSILHPGGLMHTCTIDLYEKELAYLPNFSVLRCV